jgi:2-methylisocitrate lyase-like PEP mutase family enzyme
VKPTTRLRSLLAAPDLLIAPGAYDALTARIISDIGFPVIYATGAGISNGWLGWADVGLLTLPELAETVRRMAGVTDLPIIADADTGFGNAINAIRTVRELERAGAAGIQLEDQVAPKRCGHFSGKEVIGQSEMVHKIKAVLDARSDPDFVLIARTDARGPLGLEAAIERAQAYAAAGADLTFVEAPLTKDELGRIVRDLPGTPQVANMVEGGLTPLCTADELQAMGFKLMICANTALRAAIKATTAALTRLHGERSQLGMEALICTWEERQSLVRLPQVQAWEKRYIDIDNEP